MTLVNKITETGYDTAFTVSDDANVFENYNYSGGSADGVLQSVYRYFQDHERRRNLNCVYRGFSASINGTDIEIARAGTEDAEAVIAGRVVAMNDNPRIFDIAEASPPEVFTADDTNFIYIEHSTITESSTRDGSSGETFTWKITTDISSFDDHQLVICSVDVDVGKTAFSNLVQLANPYEVEANKFRPKYDHSMGFYVGDGHIQSRNLSVLMDWDDTTFYLPIKVDIIDEETTNAGVTVEGVLIKDDIVDTSGSFTVDTITEHTTDAGVTVESVAMEDGDIDSAGGLTINTIDEHTIAAGVTVEGMLIKDITAIKADTDILYVNTIDDYSGGVLTITPNTEISGTLDVVGDIDINSKLTIAAATGNTLILGTLGVTGLVTGTAGFSGDVAGNVTGNVTGDVTGKADTADKWETTRTIGMTGDVSSDNVNIDGSGNVIITNTVVDNNSHTHITANVTDIDTASTGITKVGTIGTGVWNGTAITNTYITSITTSKISDLSTASTGITKVGTIDTGAWEGTAIANNYIAGINQDLLIASSPTFVDLTLSGTKTAYYSVSGATFRCSDATYEGYTLFTATNHRLRNDTSTEVFFVPLNLLDGSTITGFTIYGSGLGAWYVERYDISSISGLDTLKTSSTIGSEVGSISFATIDNGNYGYYVHISLTSTDEIWGFRVKYDYSPLP